jgi:hypothetical protein
MLNRETLTGVVEVLQIKRAGNQQPPWDLQVLVVTLSLEARESQVLPRIETSLFQQATSQAGEEVITL